MSNKVYFIFILLLLVAHKIESYEKQRTILAILNYNEIDYNKDDYNLVHLSAEMVLNHYGFNVIYHDLSNGLPSQGLLDEAYAVISWFQESKCPYASDYLKLAIENIKKGQKWIVLGYFGLFTDLSTNKIVSEELVREFFLNLGLIYSENENENPFYEDESENPLEIEPVYIDKSVMGFERPVEFFEYYEKFEINDPKSKVYLKLRKKGVEESESAVVVTTPYGGFALRGCTIFHDNITDSLQWYINPFIFFKEALDLKLKPIPDCTTLFGKRIFYSHIDGDGYLNISFIDNKSYSSQIIYEEILTKYNLPITVSFITAELDTRYLGNQEMNAFAKKILKLDNIETGVHGFSHPLDWDKMLTAFPLKGYSKKLRHKRELAKLSESDYEEAAFVFVDWDTYLQEETIGAAMFINKNIAPINKPAKVFQWTGNCRPPAKAIELCDDFNLPHINGGDSRFDAYYPSYTGVKALYRQIDRRVQPYASNANENIYTDNWTGPYYAFKYVIETFQQSERPTLVKAPPRRVSPINVYYHFYSGEREASLKALKEVYDYVLTQDVIPIFTSHYVDIVNSFIRLKIEDRNDGSWSIKDYKSLRTLRFNQSNMYPNLKKSKGIMGYKTWEGYTYIHLKEGGEAILYIQEEPPTLPYLVESSVVINNWKVGDKISFNCFGFKEAEVVINNLQKNASYELIKDSQNYHFITDKEGLLRIRFSCKGKYNIEIKKK